MPETPNFERIAAELATHFLAVEGLAENWLARNERRIVEQLRQVWNARGAADLAAIDDQISRSDDVFEGLVVPPPPRQFIRAIRKLDR